MLTTLLPTSQINPLPLLCQQSNPQLLSQTKIPFKLTRPLLSPLIHKQTAVAHLFRGFSLLANDKLHFEGESLPNHCSLTSQQTSTSSNSTFSIVYFNARSLPHKIDHLRLICMTSRHDIVCIVDLTLCA